MKAESFSSYYDMIRTLSSAFPRSDERVIYVAFDFLYILCYFYKEILAIPKVLFFDWLLTQISLFLYCS